MDADSTLGAWRACPREPLTLAYLAGDAAGEERGLAEEHLAGCDACRGSAAFFARLLADETAEETFVLELLARRTALAARERIHGMRTDDLAVAPEARRPEARRADVWVWILWAVLAAAIAAAVIAGLILRT